MKQNTFTALLPLEHAHGLEVSLLPALPLLLPGQERPHHETAHQESHPHQQMDGHGVRPAPHRAHGVDEEGDVDGAEAAGGEVGGEADGGEDEEAGAEGLEDVAHGGDE